MVQSENAGGVLVDLVRVGLFALVCARACAVTRANSH